MPLNVYEAHNHGRCVASALDQARQRCEERGARLTRVRLRVLELIWSSHRPVGAYELLPALASDGFNSAPPTVYRALDFLLELGLIHRINSVNAYVGCDCTDDPDHPVCFFICRACGKAQELNHDAIAALTKDVQKHFGVQVEQASTELTGLCPGCQTDTGE